MFYKILRLLERLSKPRKKPRKVKKGGYTARHWVATEVDMLIMLHQAGVRPEVIGENINRTEAAVYNRLGILRKAGRI